MGLGNFAHLLTGWGKPPKGKPGKGARRTSAEGDKDKDGAEGGDQDDQAVDGEGDDGDDDDEGDGQAAAADDGDDGDGGGGGGDDKDAKASAAIAKARRQAIAGERKRCARIFSDKSAANNIAQACELAFGTNLSADRVIAIMSTARPARGSGGLADAMSGVNVPSLPNGGGGAGSGKDDDAAANAMLNTMRKAGMIPPVREGK